MSLLKSSPPKTIPLEDRIKALQAEIDGHIDGLAKAEHERMGGGVPHSGYRQR